MTKLALAVLLIASALFCFAAAAPFGTTAVAAEGAITTAATLSETEASTWAFAASAAETLLLSTTAPDLVVAIGDALSSGVSGLLSSPA